MKQLTDNDISFLRFMWNARRFRRSDLASCDQRAGDRLVEAGIIMCEEARDDMTDRGWGGGGNGQHLVFDYEPFRSAATGDPAIVAQILERAPDVLRLRPIGKEAQALFRIVRTPA